MLKKIMVRRILLFSGDSIILGRGQKTLISGRQNKKRKWAIEQLKKQFQERLEAKKKKHKITPRPPRYDEVFYEGLETLDSLAGEEIPIIREGTVRFSDDIWKSKARFDPDVS